MPILKYSCIECGKEFSKIFFSEQYAPTKCPVCASDNISVLGDTFKSDEALASRVLCASCSSCSDDSCGQTRASS